MGEDMVDGARFRPVRRDRRAVARFDLVSPVARGKAEHPAEHPLAGAADQQDVAVMLQPIGVAPPVGAGGLWCLDRIKLRRTLAAGVARR